MAVARAEAAAGLTRRAESFESALNADPDADLAAFLPPADHPDYTAVLAELVRIDLDRAWAAGRQKRLAEYRERFPAAFADPDALAAVAFEEYRQRCLAGDPVDKGEYRRDYGVDPAYWPSVGGGDAADDDGPGTMQVAVQPVAPPDSETPTAVVAPVKASSGFVELFAKPAPPPVLAAAPLRPWELSDSQLATRSAAAAKALPEVGETFLGFRLDEELGRGAFGRVFLARQGDLAGRPVALKVAVNIAGESQTLAQLQHTNIVPIYSFHQVGQLQAVCMPYFGGTTLARVVQHLSLLPNLPASGRELHSTVHARRASTVGSVGSAAKSDPGSATASEVQPAAAPPPAVAEAVEGWGRLDELSYADAVLWLGAQLADGLGHAHDRGILHRDLKPANVLLTDDGRPMLLDFNLAEDTKLRGTAARAAVGGTLPYMPPEQLQAFGRQGGFIDARSDLFSLGVILFELLTGRHPYPIRRGPSSVTVRLMLADRQQPPPGVRELNPAVSPAVEAIVRKLMAPDANDRYASAARLREDLQRHLDHLPLRYAPNPSVKERVRKWVRRHPRLASTGTIAAAAAVVVGVAASAAVYQRERTHGFEARAALADHKTALGDVQDFLDDRHRSRPRLDEGLARLRGVLGRYGVPADGAGGDQWESSQLVRYLSDADRQRLREDVGETFYLMAQVATLRAATDPARRAEHTAAAAAWNAAAERYAGGRLPRALREQKATVATLGGDPAEGKRLRDDAAATPPRSARDRYLVGLVFAHQNRHRDALPHLQAATQIDPENFSAWFVRGTAHAALEQNELAALCFGSCTALRKEFAPAWLNRGLAYSRLRFFDQARDDYDRALSLDPSLAEGYVLRGDARLALGDPAAAAEDYGLAIEAGADPARAHFLRAEARRRAGDAAGAAADRAAGLAAVPREELGWVARGEYRAESDPVAALADVGEALRLNPTSLYALQLKAHLLAEHLNRPAEAVTALDAAVEAYSEYAPARAGRAVLFARLGRRDDAHRDAADALLRDTKAPNVYQVAGVYALTSKTHPDDRLEAFRLLWSALRTGYGLDLVDTDPELTPVRELPEFARIVKAARDLRAGGG